jgi:hypothetical protein
MPDEKNHLFGPLDMLRDSKEVNKRKSQQQYSRFSQALATSVTNATIQTNSPALQPNSKPQIGLPYDDTLGSISADVEISFQTFGSQYTFMEVTTDTAITFTGLPTGRFIEFTVDILVNQAAGVAITFPQVTNPPTLAGNDADRYVLKFIGVRRSDPTGVNPPVETYTFLAGTVTTTGGCPIICTENNLGNVTGLVDVDWSIANFHRAVLIGNTTFNIISTPGSSLWQDICLEVQQDAVGGHTVDFIQGFANSFIPVVISGALRYTSFQIYTYEEPSGTDIFQGFNKNGNNGPQVPGGAGLFQGFAGYIQTILSADQTTSLGINDHIEFDTIVDNDTLVVTGGAGQARGIFSGFRPGHTYECEVYIGGEGSDATLNWSAKWFDRVANGSIGTEAQQLAVTGAANRGFQSVGKAFFRSTSLGDSLEVRITNNTVLTSILNGSTSTEPTTFATIKDCGVVESVINQPEPAPEFGELDVRDMMYSRVTTQTSASRFDSRLQNRQDFGDVAFGTGSPLVRNIRMKGLVINVTTMGVSDRQFTLVENGTDIGPLHNIPGSSSGFIDFGPIDVLLDKTKRYGWRTVNGQSGDDWNMTMIVWFL